ncbi:MAG: twin-arginine translocase subunit TatC [Proteobacteria bacterium]|nr:twin-arginine translocase subunit TatC [Pseudomonadota bacterium]MBU1741827.1 twin-arginine translocase subunit TatC [Pseudomonadota bacterium]
MRSMLAVLVGFLVCWVFKEYLFQVLAAPVLKVLKHKNVELMKSTEALGPFLQGLVHSGIAPKLQVLHPAEAFFAFLKVALLGGVMFAVPVIFYQLWRFVAPGLYQKERRMVIPFMGAGTICFVSGVLFCYLLVLPFGLSFLADFGSQFMDYKPAVAPYLSFVVRLTFAFGLVFELPVILFFFGKIGLVTSKQLSRFRKYAILLAFVLAAILTPPDVFTQLLMAGPILLLYEVSIILVRIAEKKKKAAQAEAEFQ